MSVKESKDFKVAILGGGMGGLCLAVGLLKSGIKIDVFEQAEAFGEIGAGIGIGPNGIQALRKLGVLDEVLRISDEPLAMRTFIFKSGLPDHSLIYDYPGMETDLGLGVHRARFLDTFIQLLPPEVAHFNKKCLKVLADDDGATAFFEDGSSHTADIVIGCDGIKSVTRTAVLGKVIEPKFSGTIVFRGLIPIDAGVKAIGPDILDRPHGYMGPNKHIIVFPINSQETVNVVVFSTRTPNADQLGPQSGQPWVIPSTQAEMLSHYEGWGPQVVDLLNNITSPSKWFLHMLDPPLETYVNGNVAILGDAAHGMLPHMGSGAGQAIEDAYILSELLSLPQTTKRNLKLVLKAYDYVRRPRANKVLTRSRDVGEIYEFRGPSGDNQTGIRKDLENMWSFVWHHDLGDDVRTATEYLEEISAQSPSPQHRISSL
ncbi:hypothetical protein Clacol_008471 [Clathrus columnatus]|uniref:FAD-binding domain-containing protein n=1 Tax=Clathrus columnatus TaxID=1419009 RepID=A0AAV5AM67_9AGAM|nr:hypothetical protein Clacol_008471 [Clathrus columnatus]